MKIAPHEMLKLLGFDVPLDGITINPNDAYLYTELLRLLGKRIAVDAITEADLVKLGIGLQGARGERSTAWNGEQLDKLRSSLRLIQSEYFGMTAA